MKKPKQPDRRLLISVDMERYSRRSNLQQYEAQHAFQQLLHEAAEHVGLARVSWKRQQAGDGELAILPANVNEPTVIGRLVPELNRVVRQYNSSRIQDAKVRLRVAFHQGLVHLDGANGFPGNAVNEVSRLCDADVLKDALAAFPDAGVALIVSSTIYRDVVREYPEELRPERFRQVEVHAPKKGFRELAWICVPDEDVTTLALPDSEAAVPPAAPEARGEPTSEPGPTANSKTTSRPAADPNDGSATGIRTGDIRVEGQNAIGHGATAIGSIGGNARFGTGKRAQ